MSEDLHLKFANEIAALSYDGYNLLGNSGKPIKGEEWTLLSGIIIKFGRFDSENPNCKNLKVISLATGSKCIGRNAMSPDGKLLNDSHAEVLGRRCFLRFLYNEIKLIKSGKSSEILTEDDNEFIKRSKIEEINFKKYKIKPGVTFHLFSSHIPCGDASIIPKTEYNSGIIERKPMEDNINDGKISLSTINSVSYICSASSDNKNKRKSYNVNCTEIITQNKKQKLGLNFNEGFVNNILSNIQDFVMQDGVANECVNKLINKNSCDEISNLADSVGQIIKYDRNDEKTNYHDIYRTGAKCLPDDSRQDKKCFGVDYHTVGAVRIKPGRGDPTLSVSCSDKIARWVAVGLQGALLSLLIPEPICLSSITIGGGGPFSKECLNRALISRTKTKQKPLILQSGLVFQMSKYSPKNINVKRPSPISLTWTNINGERVKEVATHGRRLGTTKKSKDKGSLMICKNELFKLFHEATDNIYKNKTYKMVKALSYDYQERWKAVKNNLGAWTGKPSILLDFKIDEEVK